MDIVESKITKGSDGQWTAPLPFKPNRPLLPNNRSLAVRRAKSLDMSIERNPVKRKHVIDFIQKLLENQHAEPAPEIPASKERWYLPLFGVYHPMKPDKIRMVFDSSARFQDVSLNDVLLKGPDLSNSLLGILLRFRREAVAVTMDIEQMFYNFKVTTDHRDFLRFLWHADNDPEKPLVDYRMTVQVFGNSPSPAIATYGLRKSVEGCDEDVKELVTQNFYVDDGLFSCHDEDEAIGLVHRTKDALYEGGGLRLHKFASNNRQVLDSFKSDDLANDFKDLDLGSDALPMQRSLGLLWNTEHDVFTFRVSKDIKPYTKRGVLSTINSVYDPLGFASPVVIRGKLLLRDGMTSSEKLEWDDPLPNSLRNEWQAWVESLKHLEALRIQRKYSHISFSNATTREVHIFCDASKEAIGAVAYLKLRTNDSSDVSFLLGKAKVSPAGGLTIPRSELCAAVLAVELADILKDQLLIDTDSFFFYTDSQVVLGYITNETRRFYVYVGNRVSRIRLSSKPTQWKYVPSDINPADLATRSVDAGDLQSSTWLKGPEFLREDSDVSQPLPFPMIEPDSDKEVRPEVRCFKTEEVDTYIPKLGSHRFESFSSWKSLIHAMSLLKYVARLHSEHRESDLPDNPKDPDFIRETQHFIIQTVQEEVYKSEIDAIKGDSSPPKSSSLSTLSPVLDRHGLLRVGGRLGNVKNEGIIDDLSRHPIILPKQHHISSLIVRHYHQKIFHQGRHLTDGAIRAAGFWIVGGKQLVYSEIAKCLICRKLRGQLGWQFMADLPEDRLKPAPPFSYVGVDTFGPWPVVHRRTRGGLAHQKRWALLFTCLVTRAIQIELIEELSSSSFINALRRLVAIRGPVVQFRSDRGTNFVGATEDLSIDAEFVEKGPVGKFLSSSGTTWKFNPPHASHMGGAWERLIGVSRRILDSMLLCDHTKGTHLTHEVLVTLMAEVSAIVNNRPLLPVSSDPDSPCILTPSTLLTMKTDKDVSPFPLFGPKDMLKSHWKHVQVLAEEFWRRWKDEYLHTLQKREKWFKECRNLKPGDIVLMRDKDNVRNDWPMGIIERTFPSQDGRIRKVELTVVKDDKRSTFIRPVSELVLLLEVC
ncbi:hypothetical protein FSP39_006584 [Pinctada imbricata]|uniref:Integrase catalytic domain-containing protein n=1 Tax=Pinctada imbricata TaxID=66713 RepID=A0AA89BKM7_PINIB|nr:hypothetical protein FSP39_006584 [Pinctada imbricata]